jgi:hypothetical protein
MSCAVVQTGAEPPSAEQLKIAFAQVPGLTALDVSVMGRDAFGVLVKGLGREQASAMQSALAAQGVGSEVVDDAVLTELPPPKELTKVSFAAEGLEIYDLLGRCAPLEWNRIQVIAAGRARLTEFKQEMVSKLVSGPPARHFEIKVVTEAVTKEEQNEHLLLEILTAGPGLRYHAKADRMEAHLLFQCLGEQRTKDPYTNLTLFVQALAKAAPAAALNHGAAYMCEGAAPGFSYPSQTAFYREITWLFWMIGLGRGSLEPGG